MACTSKILGWKPRSLLRLLAVLATSMAAPQLADAGAGKQKGVKATKMSIACDIQVQAGGSYLAEALATAASGARLCLLPGQHAGGMVLGRSVTLVGLEGADKTFIHAAAHSSALRVDDDGLAIRLQGLTLAGGAADAGGGLAVHGRGKVAIVDCKFTNNRAGLIGGGGLYARAGLLTVERTDFAQNRGRQGGAIFLDSVVHAELTRCNFVGNDADFGGGLRATEAVVVELKICKFRQNHAGGQANALHVSGSKSRAPQVVLDHCAVEDGSVINGPEIPGAIVLKSSQVPVSWRSVSGVAEHNIAPGHP